MKIRKNQKLKRINGQIVDITNWKPRKNLFNFGNRNLCTGFIESRLLVNVRNLNTVSIPKL